MIDIDDIQMKLDNISELLDSLENSTQNEQYEILDFIDYEKQELVGYINEFIEDNQ